MKTQKQFYYGALDFSAKANECFMDMMRSDTPITKEEWIKMNAKNPSLWGRFKKFFIKD